MRISLAFFLVVLLAVPAIEVDALLLVCPEGNRPSMAFSECCCLGESSAPDCSTALLADCCCEVRASWRLGPERDEATPVPSPGWSAAIPVLPCPGIAAREPGPFSPFPWPSIPRARTAPPRLYLLHRFFLI